MIKPPKRTRDLRSSDQNVLFVSRITTKKGEGPVVGVYPQQDSTDILVLDTYDFADPSWLTS